MKRFDQFAPSPRLAFAMISFASFLWGSSVVILRAVHGEVPPLGMTFWRAFFTALVLLPVVAPGLSRHRPLIAKHWKLILFLGFAQVGGMACMALAANFTAAINLALVNAAQPAMTGIVAWLLIRERLAWPQVLGIVGALVGVIFMTVRADWQVVSSLSFNIGDLIMVGSIVLWSLYAVRMGALPREFGLTTLLFAVMVSGAALMLPLYVFETIAIRPVPLSWTSVWAIGSLAFLVTLLSVSFWNAGLRVVGPNRATIFLTLIPVFGAILAILTLGEKLYTYHLWGAVLVGSGIMLVIRFDRRRKQAAPNKAAAEQ